MKYAVVTVVDGRVTDRELRDKVGHREFHDEGDHHEHHGQKDPRGRGFGRHSTEKHRLMFESITDCDIVLARGMGRGAYQGLQSIGAKPILTDIREIDNAVEAVLDGSIEDQYERLH